jgi:HD-GYP domain-containing protein (c-di-GMP phosphodiesterase class II)
MMQLITLEQLNFSQPLPCNLYDQKGKVLLRKGSLLDWDDARTRLCSLKLFILPEPAERISARDPEKPQPPVTIADPFEECQHLEARLHTTLQTDDPGEFHQNMHELVGRLERLLHQHFDLTFAFLVLTQGDNYPTAHQLHAGMVVARLVGKLPSIKPAHHRGCIQAALTMNIGMMALQSELVVQQTGLTDAQREAIKRHPEEGMQRLKKLGVTDPIWLQTVLDHHERPNGSGYPMGTRHVSLEAELVSMADIFCAKVSTRGYRRAITPGQAARDLLLLQGGGAAQQDLASLLIREVGVYPPGTFVKLASNELAIVVRRGLTAVTPTVISIMTHSGMPLSRPIKRDCSAKEFAVVGVVRRDKIPMHLGPPNGFWDLVSEVEGAQPA